MKGTVIHYSVTPPRGNHGDCAGQVEGIRNYHLSTGYQDIAYGWLVCQHGGVFEGRGWGPNAANGNSQLNQDYHSICWLGDADTVPSEDALAAISKLLDEGPDARREVLGHRDVSSTSCPGDALEAWVQAGATVTPPSSVPQEDDMAFTATDEDGTNWHFAGVHRREITWDQANALAGLAQPVKYQGAISNLARDAYSKVR